MNIVKSTALLAGAFSLAATLAQAQSFSDQADAFFRTNSLDLYFRDTKNFKMTGPYESDYLGGELNIFVGDGVTTLLSCAANGDVFYVSPNIFCPSGTTGLVTSGDIDGDGIRDTGSYFSITQPIPAVNIEPFKTDLVELFSAPPSELPRPQGSFSWKDRSRTLFYDLINDPVNGVGYEIAIFESNRPYLGTELERHRSEIVPGTYIFKFPGLGSTEDNPSNFFMSVSHREMVEAVPGPGGRSIDSGGIDVGNDFRLTNDDRWNEGLMEFDPRIVFSFEWSGFNPQTFSGNDRLFFSIKNRETEQIVFPPIPDAIPPNPQLPQLIGSSNLGIPTGYDLGPDFFAPNQELVAELEFVRRSTTGASQDRSTRVYRWDINLIDTYPGFVRQNFDPGTSDELIGPDADFDGDGYTNLEEFGLQTSATDPASIPNPTPVLIGNDQCYLEIAKRPATGSRLDYIMQYSSDQENWTTIEEGDPNWFIVFNNDERISVLSRSAYNANPCFLRVQFEQN
jgi:hypothetical protein